MTIEFFMPMQPPTITHQEKKIRTSKGRPVVYEPPELKEARAKLTAHLAQYAPAEPMQAPVAITAIWCFAADRNHAHGTPKTTKPDIDNMQKLLLDCMTKVNFWHDDSVIASANFQKWWSDVPGIYIKVERMECVRDGSIAN